MLVNKMGENAHARLAKSLYEFLLVSAPKAAHANNPDSTMEKSIIKFSTFWSELKKTKVGSASTVNKGFGGKLYPMKL
jgi:hypothetical protein